MEDLEYEVTEEYKKTPKWIYCWEWGWKAIVLGIGIFITVLLYNKCLFNPNCNVVVAVYFALIGLACFAHIGLPIDKLTNVKLN
ncbi:MAG: hypothetical protein QME49_00335 [bacterium]|nr:hypothetical protein [bacterium]